MSVQPHMMQAQAFAGSMSSELGNVQRRYGRAESSAYKQIPDVLVQLEQALETAISTDEQQASGFWVEMRSFIKHGFDYFGEKRRFDAQVQSLVQGARTLMRAIKAVVTGQVVPKIPLPEQLMDASTRWQSVADRTSDVGQQVPPLQSVDGWSGPAYAQYQTMAGVQVEATKEFSGLPRLLEGGYRDAADINKAVLAMVHSSLQGALSSAAQCYAAPSGRYYVNTANVSSALQQVASKLGEVVKSGEEPAQALGQALAESQASAVVIDHGWPTGTSQAGQRAGETARDIPAQEVPPTDPGTGIKAPPSQGLER